jgi:hypothetical protein
MIRTRPYVHFYTGVPVPVCRLLVTPFPRQHNRGSSSFLQIERGFPLDFWENVALSGILSKSGSALTFHRVSETAAEVFASWKRNPAARTDEKLSWTMIRSRW